MSDEAARKRIRRVVQNEMSKLARRRSSITYLYPAGGIGAIPEAFKEKLLANGGKLELGAAVEKLSLNGGRRVDAIHYRRADGTREVVKVANLISTIPPDALHALLKTEAEAPLFDLRWRALRLLFLVTEDWREKKPETHYVPSPRFLVGRVSEIAKYSPDLARSDGRKAFTVEIPCTPGDKVWNMDLEELSSRCVSELVEFGILKAKLSAPTAAATCGLAQVYPLYTLGWRERYKKVAAFFNSFSNLYCIGRSALFLHCNLDHSISMGLKLADWLAAGNGKEEDLRVLESEFENYYVRE